MPAATSIAQILNFGGVIDPALAQRLNDSYVAAFNPRAVVDLPDSYAFPYFTKGESTGHKHALPAAVGGWEYDIFTGCIITVELFAPRLRTDVDDKYLSAVYDKLGDLALRARAAFSFNNRPVLNALLSFHHIDPMVPLADVVGFDEQRSIDRHELRWRCLVGIKGDAWPVDPTAYVLPAPTGAGQP